jgi:hypothetical protein
MNLAIFYLPGHNNVELLIIPIVATTLPLESRTGAANALTPPGDLFVGETIALFPNSPKGFG